MTKSHQAGSLYFFSSSLSLLYEIRYFRYRILLKNLAQYHVFLKMQAVFMENSLNYFMNEGDGIVGGRVR
jgi:hypothetical protein